MTSLSSIPCVGVVFCVGGRGASGDPFKSIECYDLRRDRWFQVMEMCSRRRHVGVVSVGGRYMDCHVGVISVSGRYFDCHVEVISVSSRYTGCHVGVVPASGRYSDCCAGVISVNGRYSDRMPLTTQQYRVTFRWPVRGRGVEGTN